MAETLIALSMNMDGYPTRLEADAVVQLLIARYRALPRHIARKHLGSSMRKVLRRGVPILRSHTPPLATRRGRRKKGEKKLSTGDLRRSVTTRVGQTGRNNDFDMFVWGCLGYKAGPQSRKALWLQYGTSGGITPYRMIEKTMAQMGPVAASDLAREMAVGLEKAAKEIAGGRNPGRAS